MVLNTHDRDIVVAALKHAAPYIRLYKRKTFVIKAGGELFVDAGATRALLEQVAIRELELRQTRLARYHDQARYALADSYDRASRSQRQGE